MRIAYLIQCHKNKEQINMLVDSLKGPDVDCYIHVDKKSNMDISALAGENVFLVPSELRVSVAWGDVSQVQATLELLRLMRSTQREYDYVWLISGQDFPIKSHESIVKYLEAHQGQNFMHVIKDDNEKLKKKFDKRNEVFFPRWVINRSFLPNLCYKVLMQLSGGRYHTFELFKRKKPKDIEFYYGSQWWTLTLECVDYILDYSERNPDLFKYYTNSICPDESFFQTILMNSKFRDTLRDHLVYIDWSARLGSPKTFTVDDFETLKASPCLFARKFDMDVDQVVLERFI